MGVFDKLMILISASRAALISCVGYRSHRLRELNAAWRNLREVSWPVVMIDRAGSGEMVEISFGNATLRAPRASEEQRARGVEDGRRAMQGLAKAITALPGVKLERIPGVPRFYADAHSPQLVVRELDGVRQRGTFVEGRFVEV